MMGQHDRDNTKDEYWPKLVPKDDMRDEPGKDDGGKHATGESDQDKNDQDDK